METPSGKWRLFICRSFWIICNIFSPLSDREAKILDYQTQQQKLLPQLATAYAFYFVAKYLRDFFDRGYMETKEGKFDLLPEVTWRKISNIPSSLPLETFKL